jgi:hypothetical protein
MTRKQNKTIRAAYVRTYSDNGQVVAIIDWDDESRTEGPADGTHMKALLARAERNGLTITRHTF